MTASGLESELYECNSATIVEVGTSLETAAYTKRLHLRVDAETVAVRAQDGDEVIARPDLLSMTQASACARRLTQYRPAADGHTEPHGWLDLMGIDDTPFRSREVLEDSR